MKALRARLAQPEPWADDDTAHRPGGLPQPEPEPAAWLDDEGFSWVPGELPDEYAKNCKPLYLAPPQREWHGLTDEAYEAMAEQYVTNCYFDTLKYARAIEAKLKEKNG